MSSTFPAPIRFQRPILPPPDQVERYFELSREARWYSNFGPCHSLLESRLEQYLGRPTHCLPVANGTLGLMVALRALAPERLKRFVVLPSFTFVATLNAICWAGYEPLFSDIDPSSWHLAPDALQETLERFRDQIAAVIPVTAFGSAPPLHITSSWRGACSDLGVPLLVDAAAGFGSLDEFGRRVGGEGDAQVFSFHATKPFAVGEGGMVCTANPDLARDLKRRVNFDFDARREPHDPLGANAKMSEIHCATALATLDIYDDVLRRRRRLAMIIRDELEAAGFRFQDGSERSTWQFVSVLANDGASRDAAAARCDASGIETRQYYDPLHLFPAFRSVARHGDLPVTRDVSQRILCLPMSNDLADNEVERIIGAMLPTSRQP